tara:strand:- start:1760 stop:3898 length:2139 start_codon:yes stop_codon:yes gene_type:complete
MGKLGRWVLRVIGLVLVLLIAAVVYLTQVLNPNDFRGDIEQAAAAQGVPLKLEGDVGWSFWPRLGLNVQQVSVGEGDTPLLDADSMAVAVAIAPLLQRQLVVESLVLDGVSMQLLRDRQGRNNWDLASVDSTSQSAAASQTSMSQTSSSTPENASNAKPAAEASSVSSTPALAIASISFTDLNIHYQDQSNGTDLRLQDVQLQLDNFDLTGQVFEWQHQSELMLPDRPPLGVDSRGQARFDINQQQVSLLESVVTLRANQSELQWRAKGDVDLASAAAELHVGLTPVNLAQWLTQWQVQLPPMAAADALNHVGGSVKMRGEGSQWRFDELSLALDNARWVGHGALSESGELALVINVDQLNLDRYLPMDAPASKPQSQAQTASSAGAREPAKTDSKKRAQSQRVVPALSAQTLDFEPIRDLRASLSLGVSQFTAKQLTFDDLVLKVTVDRGLINVKRLKTGLDDGDIDLSARLDARTDNAKLKLDTQVTDLELKPLLTTLMDESRLSGAAAMTLALVSEGNSLRAWQQQLRGKVELNTQALTLNDIDIERSACELAATINRKPVPNIDWKQRTEFQQLQAQLQLQAGERLQIESITAQVENIRVKARGRLALNNGKFDVPMDAAFVGEADPERDCQVRDRWRNRDLPLRCKGQLASVSARSCGADKDRLEALITDEVKAEASDKLKSKLQEKLGDENAEAVDQLLRGLFKRK